jgi:hypothetical protein
MEGLVSGAMIAEQELLEKPGGMGAVPFRGARIRHGLNELIFGREGGSALLGFISHREKRFGQIRGAA